MTTTTPTPEQTRILLFHAVRLTKRLPHLEPLRTDTASDPCAAAIAEADRDLHGRPLARGESARQGALIAAHARQRAALVAVARGPLAHWMVHTPRCLDHADDADCASIVATWAREAHGEVSRLELIRALEHAADTMRRDWREPVALLSVAPDGSATATVPPVEPNRVDRRMCWPRWPRVIVSPDWTEAWQLARAHGPGDAPRPGRRFVVLSPSELPDGNCRDDEHAGCPWVQIADESAHLIPQLPRSTPLAALDPETLTGPHPPA